MKIRSTIILFFLLNTLYAQKTWQSFYAQAPVNTIIKDYNGTMWFGMRGTGLASFDGTNWQYYHRTNKGLKDNNVSLLSFKNPITASSSQAIWIVNNDNDYSIYTRITRYYQNNMNPFASLTNQIRSITQNNYNMWLGTGGGVLMYGTNDVVTTYTTLNSGLLHDNVTSIAFDKTGGVWMATDAGVNILKNNVWTSYNSYEYGNIIDKLGGVNYKIAIDKNNVKWIGTQTGLYKYDDVKWTKYDLSNSGISGSIVYDVIIDAKNNKWLITNVGISKFNDTTWTTYSKANSIFKSDKINCIAEGNKGEIWAGDDFGAYKFDGQKWNYQSTANSGLPSNNISSTVTDNENNVWLGTDIGLVKYNGTEWKLYTTSNSGLAGNTIVSISKDKSGTLWIGTLNGLSKYDGKTWTSFTKKNSSICDSIITNISYDKTGKMWLGTENNGLCSFDGINFQNFNPTNSGIIGKKVVSVLVDYSGNIWSTTEAGLNKLTNTTWSNYYLYNFKLPTNHVRAIGLAPDSTVWVGEEFGKKYYYKNNTWSCIGCQNSMNSSFQGNTITYDTLDKGFWFLEGDLIEFYDFKKSTFYGSLYIDLPAKTTFRQMAYDQLGQKWFGSSLGLHLYSNPTVLAIATEDAIQESISSSLYPNPVRNKLIVSKYSDSEASGSIYSIDGAKILDLPSLTIQDSDIIIDATFLKPGIYVLKIQGKTDNKTFKFSKE